MKEDDNVTQIMKGRKLDNKNPSSVSYYFTDESNTHSQLFRLLDKKLIADILEEYLGTLNTATFIYEVNSKNFLGLYAKSWCRFLMKSSFDLCSGETSTDVIKSGQWCCLESCRISSQKTIEFKQPLDGECSGRSLTYFVPIIVQDKPLGAIGFAYGNPSQQDNKLSELAAKYGVTCDNLKQLASSYPQHFPFIIDITKKHLRASAKLIGSLCEQKIMKQAYEKSEYELMLRNKIAHIFLTVTDEKMYSDVLTLFLDTSESKYGVFGYIDERGDLVVPTMTREVWHKCTVPHKNIIFPKETWGTSSWVQAIKEKKTNYTNTPSHNLPQGHICITRHISLPIVHKDKAVGLIQIANKETDYTDEDIKLLENLVSPISFILNARLEKEQQEKKLKSTTELLQEKTENLTRSNKELEQFAYVASHDLQEPLRKIIAFGDRLKVKYGSELNDKGRDYIEQMENAASRMQTLINDLLTLSRITSKAQPFISVDLNEVLKNILSDLEDLIRRVQGHVHVNRLPSIDADPLQMRQLFQNLISNALKFHKKNTAPLVKIHGSLTDTSCSTQNLHLEVQDNGIGFDEKYSDHIFKPFQRLHSRDEYEGTGIGLAISQKIIERHGGNIKAESCPEEGTVFKITLPVKQKYLKC